MKRDKDYLKDGYLAFILILAILVIDQIIKIEVKMNMSLGESIHIADWFYITFVENNGMAYGITFFNKLFLSIMRIIAIGGVCWYMSKEIRRPDHRISYIVVLSMIVAGALGNVFDSMFYGLVFTESTPYAIAHVVPFGDGYASFLQGKVVDMFYFPIFHTTWPEWMTFIGGHDYTFFSPVFNFADANISVGVVLLLLFYSKDLENVMPTIKASYEGSKLQKLIGKGKDKGNEE